MKFSTLASVAGLSALASASPAYTVQYTGDVVCTDATVTQTVTVTVDGTKNGQVTGAPSQNLPPMITTAAGTVTSVDYDGTQSTVYVYPTGSGSHDAIKVIYENTVIIDIVVINIDVTIINDVTSTVTSTLTVPPTSTPPPPPPASSSTSSTSSSTSSSSSSVQTHIVQVGVDGDLLYGPNQLNASLNDVIRFEFLKLNHTVTQSSFAEPCTKLDGGFDSGFNFFNPNNVTDSATFTTDFIVNTTSPLWFYCRQAVPKSHCHAGMVLGVNPAGKFPAFLAMAEATGQSAKRDHTRRAAPVALPWTA